MKKKEQLLQILKKDAVLHLTDYLRPLDLVSLCVVNKKYYMVLLPLINNVRLDNEEKNKPSRIKNNKKNKKKEEVIESKKETQVYIEKIALNKFSKGFLKGEFKNWKKVEKLDFYNEYLDKKIQNNAVTFYQNLETNEIIYINRSMVDPNLNYNKGGFGEDFINSSLYEHIYNEGTLTQYDLASQENLLKRQKEILNKINIKKEEEIKNSQINYEDQLVKAMSMKKIGIILCFGGSFSFGIYQGGRCLIHKSDKKYVTRQKGGQRQFNKDKNSGSSIQSIGSQIRRDQQKKHVINVGQILKQHHSDLNQCQIIFLQAPGLNRLFVINENENMNGLQDRLRSVCITAKKANFTQIQALYQAISQVNIVNIGSKEEYFKDKNSKRTKNK